MKKNYFLFTTDFNSFDKQKSFKFFTDFDFNKNFFAILKNIRIEPHK